MRTAKYVLRRVGLKSGKGWTFDPILVLRKSVRLTNIYVGSREWFQNMDSAIDANAMRSVIDRTFEFEDARTEYVMIAEVYHFSVFVIRVS